jgi:hypothetical protein
VGGQEGGVPNTVHKHDELGLRNRALRGGLTAPQEEVVECALRVDSEFFHPLYSTTHINFSSLICGNAISCATLRLGEDTNILAYISNHFSTDAGCFFAAGFRRCAAFALGARATLAGGFGTCSGSPSEATTTVAAATGRFRFPFLGGALGSASTSMSGGEAVEVAAAMGGARLFLVEALVERVDAAVGAAAAATRRVVVVVVVVVGTGGGAALVVLTFFLGGMLPLVLSRLLLLLLLLRRLVKQLHSRRRRRQEAMVGVGRLFVGERLLSFSQ